MEDKAGNATQDDDGSQAATPTSDIKTYNCLICAKNFSSCNDLTQHVQSHVGILDIKALQGDRVFKATTSTCTTGLTCSTDIETFNCLICAKKFSSCNDLTEHLHTHSGAEKFDCKLRVCAQNRPHNVNALSQSASNTETDTKKSCVESSLKHTTPQVPQDDPTMRASSSICVQNYVCEICGEDFCQNRDLILHMSTHTGVKTTQAKPKNPVVPNAAKCDICDKYFLDRAIFSQHMAIHTGIKKFICELCGKAFLRSGHLSAHMNGHTGVKHKTFECNYCNKTFSRKYNLKQHIAAIHTGAKNYKCKLCDKAFSQRSPLAYHMYVHTGIKNYKCEVCGKSFFESGSLSRHMNTHTGNKPFKCDVCCKSFGDGSTLKRHMKTHGETKISSNTGEASSGFGNET